MSDLRSESTPSFRRRLVAAPRRRSHPLLRLLALVLRLGVVLLPAGGVAAWVLFSSAFALRTLEVSGNRRVAGEWVEAALRADLGRNLVRLDLGAVDERLEEHPWIRSVELHKRLPDHLQVEVVEHRAAALLELGEELVFVSDEGTLITPYDGRVEDHGPVGRPAYLVIGTRLSFVEERGERLAHASADGRSARPGPGREVPELRRALALVRRLQEEGVAWSGELERIEILGEEDYLLRVGSVPFPILVRAEISSSKARALDELLPQILARFEPLAAIDLRFSRRIVVKGAAQTPREGIG